ncbi:MAG: glycosyltransferase [Flavobacteriales bacterium]|nr:glycosyltransferase [Flavobacteriales bacterium]
MNILFLTFWYPTQELPGKGIFIQEQAITIAKTGVNIHVVHVCIQKGSGLFSIEYRSETVADLPTTRIIISSMLWKGYYYFSRFFYKIVERRVFKLAEAGRFDMIHSNVVFPAGIFGDRLSKKMGIPHIISEHWSGLNKFFTTHLDKNRGRQAYNRTAAILAVSDFLREAIKPFVNDPAKISIVPNVVPQETFHFKAKKPDTDRPIRFIAVANWTRGKVQFKFPELVIQAIGNIHKSHPGYKIELEFIGSGNMIDAMKKQASDLGIKAIFSGQKPKSYIAQKMQSSDFLLHPTLYETFSVVIAESLMCGLPVIASEVAAIPELINEENGVLTKNDVPSWESAILQAMTRTFDRAMIASTVANKFSQNSVGHQISSIYTSVLERIK